MKRNLINTAVVLAVAFVTTAYRSAGQETAPATPKPAAAAAPAQAPPAVNAPDASKPAPALNGLCPAAYLLQGNAVKGDPAIQSTFQGEVYYFSSADAKKQFDAAPGKFLPQFGGLCTTALGGTYGNRFLGEPDLFDVHDGKVYLFSSERAKQAYVGEPKTFIFRAQEIFGKPALFGYCPVSYRDQQTATRGNEALKYVYRQFVVYFADEAKRKAFIAEPEKYFPQYEGFCAKGVADGQRYPSEPNLFVVYNGRTYLFYNEKSRDAFMQDPATIVKAADANWPALRIEGLTPKSKRR